MSVEDQGQFHFGMQLGRSPPCSAHLGAARLYGQHPRHQLRRGRGLTKVSFRARETEDNGALEWQAKLHGGTKKKTTQRQHM